MPSLDQLLQAKAIQLGKLSVEATTAAGSGHPSTSLSLAHITAVLMYHIMRWDPLNPGHPGSDRLVLSEGHAVPIIYAACADLGVMFYPHGLAAKETRRMTAADLMTLRAIDSPIDGHPNPMCGFPFFDAATGSLGQGLSVAAGLGAAAKVDHLDRHIFCIIGDGESREGQIWEAMDFIADQHLTSVIPIFNCNELGQSDWVAQPQSRDALMKKAEAYGFSAVRVDGHNPAALVQVLENYLRQRQQNEHGKTLKPLAIIAETVKGWGAKTEQGLGKHGTPVSAAELPKVLAELDQTGRDLGVGGITDFSALTIAPPLAAPKAHAPAAPRDFSESVNAAKLVDAVTQKKKLSPRRAFGLALDALGESNPGIIGLDADVQNSTYSQDFAKHHPERFFECKIAEQNMISVAVGIAAAGKIPFASTFGKFFVRAYDQIEMGIISGANFKLVGTHIGVTLAADGPSQMAIVDSAFMRAIGHARDHRGQPAIITLTPSDAISTYYLVLEMAKHPSAVYLRALRADVPILYPEMEKFPIIGHKEVHKPDGARLTIVTNGYLVHTCLKVAKTLADQGTPAAIIDAYSLPADTGNILAFAEQHGGRILTVEDNYVGGLNSEIAEAAAATGKVKVSSLNVRNLPKSGKTPEDVLAYVHLSEKDIAEAARKMLNS